MRPRGQEMRASEREQDQDRERESKIKREQKREQEQERQGKRIKANNIFQRNNDIWSM